jgi:hypothetical protein
LNTEEYYVNTEEYYVNTEEYYVNTEKYYVNTEEYYVNTEEYDVNTEEYYVNTEEYYVNTTGNVKTHDEYFVTRNDNGKLTKSIWESQERRNVKKLDFVTAGTASSYCIHGSEIEFRQRQMK